MLKGNSFRLFLAGEVGSGFQNRLHGAEQAAEKYRGIWVVSGHRLSVVPQDALFIFRLQPLGFVPLSRENLSVPKSMGTPLDWRPIGLLPD